MTYNPETDGLFATWNGSSNSGSWQSEPDQLYSRTATPASLPNARVWSRFSDATHRAALTGGPFGWENLGAATHNFQQDGPSGIYFAARKLSEFYFDDLAPRETTPGIGFAYFSYSSSSATPEIAPLGPTLSLNPFAENVADTGPAQLFLDGYVGEALANLTGSYADVYVDAIYYIGDEFASADPAGAFANDTTKYTVAAGINDYVSGVEAFMGVAPGEVPVIYVQTPRVLLNNANIASNSDIEAVRDQQAMAIAALPNPTVLLDGERFAVRTSDSTHYTTDAYCRMGEAMAEERLGLGVPPAKITGTPRSTVWPIDSDE